MAVQSLDPNMTYTTSQIDRYNWLSGTIQEYESQLPYLDSRKAKIIVDLKTKYENELNSIVASGTVVQQQPTPIIEPTPVSPPPPVTAEPVAPTPAPPTVTISQSSPAAPSPITIAPVSTTPKTFLELKYEDLQRQLVEERSRRVDLGGAERKESNQKIGALETRLEYGRRALDLERSGASLTSSNAIKTIGRFLDIGAAEIKRQLDPAGYKQEKAEKTLLQQAFAGTSVNTDAITPLERRQILGLETNTLNNKGPGTILYSQPGSLTGGGQLSTTGTKEGSLAGQGTRVFTATQGQLAGATIIITQGKKSETAGELSAKLLGADISGYQAPIITKKENQGDTTTLTFDRPIAAGETQAAFAKRVDDYINTKNNTTENAQLVRDRADNGSSTIQFPAFTLDEQKENKSIGDRIILDAAKRGEEANAAVDAFYQKNDNDSPTLSFVKGSVAGISKIPVMALQAGQVLVGRRLVTAQNIVTLNFKAEQDRVKQEFLAVPTAVLNLAKGVKEQVSTSYGLGEFTGQIALGRVIGNVQTAKANMASAAYTQQYASRVIYKQPTTFRSGGYDFDITGRPIEGMRYVETAIDYGGIRSAPGSAIIPRNAGGAIDLTGSVFTKIEGAPAQVKAGVRISTLQAEPILGERVTVSPDAISGKYLVDATIKQDVTFGPSSARPTTLPSEVSAAKILREPVRIITEATDSQVQKIIPPTAVDAKTGRVQFLVRERITPSNSPAGTQTAEFNTGEFRLYAIDDAGSPGSLNNPFRVTLGDVERLGFEVKKVTGPKPYPELETLRTFSEQGGDFFVRLDDGQTYLVGRSTEARRFRLGAKEIPGRKVQDVYKLPDAASTNKNIPKDVILDFADLLEAQRLQEIKTINLGKKASGPVLVEKITVTPSNVGKGASTTVAGVASSSGTKAIDTGNGQVLIQETAQTTSSVAAVESLEQPKTTQTSLQTTKNEPLSNKQETKLEKATVDIGKVAQKQFESFRKALGLKQRNSTVLIFNQETQKPTQTVLPTQALVSRQASSTKPAQDLRSAQAIMFDADTATAQDTMAAQMPQQDAALAQISATDIALRTSQVYRQDYGFRLKEIEQKVRFGSPKSRSNEKTKGRNFRVLVRKGGRFVELAGGLSFADAVSQGQTNVLNTAAASFKVETTQGEAVQSADVLSYLRGDTFRLSKRDRGVVVQKEGARIRSIGEKQQITFKGISASRQRRRR